MATSADITHEALEALAIMTTAFGSYADSPAKKEALELADRAYRTGQLILAQPSGDEVDAVADAIERAECPGREGPFGGYDYGHNEAFYGKAPDGGRYVIRDFRDPASPDWGKWLHQTENRDEHDAMFKKMTREHIATSAITALDAHRGKQACLKDRENSDG